jgi:molecular chaperone GrpE
MKKERKKRMLHIPVSKGEKKAGNTGKKDKTGKDKSKAVEKTDAPDAAQIEKKAREYDELVDTLQRLKAEYANYQKRTERERGEFREQCVREVLLKMLPVLDNIERAVDSAKKHGSTEELLPGVELILKQFRQVLALEEVHPFDSVGEKFDPRYHDALLVQELDEAAPDTVISEVERGYMIGDKVLRAAKVSVSRKPREVKEEPE